MLYTIRNYNLTEELIMVEEQVFLRELRRGETSRFGNDIVRLVTQLSRKANREHVLEDLRDSLKAQSSRVFIAVEPGKNTAIGLGVIVFGPHPSGIDVCIHDIIVDEESRRRSVGSLILDRLLQEAQGRVNRRRRATRVRLTSNPNNPDRTKAQAMYRKKGFKLVARADGQEGTNLYAIQMEPNKSR